MNKEALMDLLLVAKWIYNRQDLHSMDKEIQNDDITRLHDYGVLSANALGAVVGVSNYRVNKAIEELGMARATARGNLNPSHITMLIYSLSTGDIPERFLEEMTENGTDISTISDLTGISEATLYRKKGK